MTERHAVGDSLTHPRHYLSPLDGGNPVGVDRITYQAAGLWDYDVHVDIEVGVVVAGEQERASEGASFLAGPGDIWMAGIWEPHGYRVVLPNTKVVCVLFHPEFLGHETICGLPWMSLFAAPPAERPRVHDETVRKRVLAIAGQLEEEMEWKPVGWQDGVRFGLLNLLLMVARGRGRSAPEGFAQSSGFDNHLARLMPIIAALRAAPSKSIRAREAAATCGVSVAHFRRIFRSALGVSFGRFSLRARISFAAHLLTTTEWPVEAVAEEAGFTDASHLHRAFAKHYGCTPGQYRERHR